MAFDLEGARKAGYNDAEIAAHLAQTMAFDLAGAKKAGYSDGEVIAHLIGKQSDPGQIPGQDPKVTAMVPAAVSPVNTAPQSVGDKIIGAGEAALSTATGLTGGTVGMIGGTLKGLAEQILAGQFGTPEAANLVEKAASEGAQALTYAPRTPSGQEQAAAVGQALQQVVPVAAVAPALMPAGAGARSAAPSSVLARAGAEGVARDAANLVARPAEMVGAVAPGAAGEAAAGAVAAGTNAAASGVARAAKAATTLPRRALDRITGTPEPAGPTPGTMGSVGAAGTDMAAQRVATANNLPIPLGDKLTKGMATRDPAQLKFETETAKLPEQGAPLRQRVVELNQAILSNMDTMFDLTGANAPSLRAVGGVVDQALVKQVARDKAKVNVMYRLADKSPEAAALVDHGMQVSIGEGANALTSTPFTYINSKPVGLQTTALTDFARQAAVKLGIAELRDGELVPRPATIKQMETWRREISQATGFEPVQIRDSTILKALIDGQTEPVAGPLYRQARATRARFAQNYEDHAVIAKLLGSKKGTTDRAVAFEDVFDHAILKGSLDDVRQVRRVLHRAGEDGAQAWRELQGAAAQWLKDEATKNVATDSAGNRVVSPAALDTAIRTLDADGRLDFIFSKRGAQQLRDLRDLAQYVKTVPPEAAVNASNTAATLMAFADVTFSGLTGAPAPIATVTRLAIRSIKDRALRRRIEDALNNPAKQAPARVDQGPLQAPSATIH